MLILLTYHKWTVLRLLIDDQAVLDLSCKFSE